MIRAERTQLDQIVAGGAQVLGQANDTMERVKKLLTDENVESISASLKNIETITTKLAADDGLIDQATGTMKDLSRASNEFATASEAAAVFSTNANEELAGLSGQLDELLAEVGKVVSSAETVMAQGGETVRVVNGLLEGPATGVVEDSRLAAQDLRILISRMDRLTREIEQNPQSMLVGEPVPYEDKR